MIVLFMQWDPFRICSAPFAISIGSHHGISSTFIHLLYSLSYRTFDSFNYIELPYTPRACLIFLPSVLKPCDNKLG